MNEHNLVDRVIELSWICYMRVDTIQQVVFSAVARHAVVKLELIVVVAQFDSLEGSCSVLLNFNRDFAIAYRLVNSIPKIRVPFSHKPLIFSPLSRKTSQRNIWGRIQSNNLVAAQNSYEALIMTTTMMMTWISIK